MSVQHTPRPSWLDGGAEAVAMAAEDGLLPEAQHTPEPWRIERHRVDGKAVCCVVRGYGSSAEYMRTHLGSIERFTEAGARAAIAKATGSAS
jgi:hypothetical protein